LIGLMACLTSGTFGQAAFQEMVGSAFGSDQQLVNGIQYSNHYGRFEGHPYFTDGHFHEGSLLIDRKLYTGVRMRYNLYSQRPEIEYRTVDGHLNQFMAVPERISWFQLRGTEFWRLELENSPPAYYQVVALMGDTCYVSWMKQTGSSTGSISGYRFNSAEVHCTLKMGSVTVQFHNPKTLIKSFPALKRRTLKGLMKALDFPLRDPAPARIEDFVRKLIQMYREEALP